MPRRGKRSVALKTQFERKVIDRLGDQFQSMVKREKDFAKLQRRPVRPMPFNVEEYREAVLDMLGGRADGVKQCAYCSVMLNIQTLVPDHATPLAAPWYGRLGLENIVLACDVCNRRKGRMSAEGFQALVKFMTETLDPRDANSVYQRLATGGGYHPLKKRFEKLAGTGKPSGNSGQGKLL